MNITLRTPLSFTEIGRKDNQEDRLYPVNGASASSRTFILCDGMGGHARGEVAAEVVSTTLGNALDSHTSASVSENEFGESLALCYKALDEKLAGDDSRRPGTTLTCVRFGDNGVLAAHIGDSRIYHVRPGVGIMFRTSDHSLVNELVRAGQITEAEALVHPRRNVITRAMMPGASNPPKADITLLSDIQSGDYFFLCCDGVLERLRDQRLITILSDTNLTDNGKLNAIKAICDKGTRDNYTAWLIPIDSVEGNSVPAGQPQIPISATLQQADEEPVQATIVTPHPAGQKKKNNLLIYGIAGALALIAVFALAITKCSGNDQDTESTAGSIDPTEQVQDQAPEAQPTQENHTRQAAEKTQARHNKRSQDQQPAKEAPEPEKTPAVTPDDNSTQSSSAAAAAALAKPDRTPATDKPSSDPKTEPDTEPQPLPISN